LLDSYEAIEIDSILQGLSKDRVALAVFFRISEGSQNHPRFFDFLLLPFGETFVVPLSNYVRRLLGVHDDRSRPAVDPAVMHLGRIKC